MSNTSFPGRTFTRDLSATAPFAPENGWWSRQDAGQKMTRKQTTWISTVSQHLSGSSNAWTCGCSS